MRVLGSDAGVTAAFNGGTHMPLEDAAMYLSIPGTTVLDPADYDQLASVTRGLADVEGVSFTRFVRKDVIRVYDEGSEFEIGKGVVLHESDKDQAAIITSGIMVDESLKAYEALQAEGSRRTRPSSFAAGQCGFRTFPSTSRPAGGTSPGPGHSG